MIEKESNEQVIDNSIYKYFVGVTFLNTPRAYFDIFFGDFWLAAHRAHYVTESIGDFL